MEPRTPETLLEQGRSAKREHRLEDARSLFKEALGENASMDDLALRAKIYEELAYVERSLRDLDAAQEHYRESSEIYRRLDNPLKTAHTVRHAADILREQKKTDLAEPLYSEALSIYRSHHETPPLDLGNAIRGFALLKEEAGDRAQALSLWREAGDIYRVVGIDAGIAESAARIRSLSE